jgi:hypothetical protein
MSARLFDFTAKFVFVTLLLAISLLAAVSSDARVEADVAGVTTTVTQTVGPASAAEPGDLLTYRYTVTGSSSGNTANTQLIGTLDGGDPGGTAGANGTFLSLVGLSGVWMTGECAIDQFTDNKEFSCTDATGPLSGTGFVDAVMRVEPIVDDRLFPPNCLVQDDGAGEVSCNHSSIALQFIDIGTPAAASDIVGVPSVFAFRLADGVTCASDTTDNNGTRSCAASDVSIQNTGGASCARTAGPTVGDTDLDNDTIASVTISSATVGTCNVTLATKLDLRTCPSSCTGATFIDTIDAVGAQSYVADDDGDGVPNGQDNCPATSNASQANQDGDPAGDACEAAHCVNVPNWWTSQGAATDPDCDGFTTAMETHADIATDPNDPCPDTSAANDENPDDKWPADFNDNQQLTTLDLVGYATRFNTEPVTALDRRHDLNQSGLITTLDLVYYATALNQSCVPAG